MRRIALVVLLLIPIFARANAPRVLSRIAFEACVHQDKPVGPGAISTDDAKKKVGEKATVELTVNSTGMAGKRIFLNSEKNRRDEKNFTIMIDMDKAAAKFKEAKIDDPRKHFNEKTIRVTGTVSKYQE